MENPLSGSMRQVADALLNAKKIAIWGHVNPDGDCIGASYALWLVCERLGKEVTFFLPDPPSNYFSFLPRLHRYTIGHAHPNQYDTLVVVDTGVVKRSFVRDEIPSKTTLVVIDHHLSSDGEGDVTLLDSSSSSASGLIAEFLFACFPEHITPDVATALFIGVSTDTGHFMREKDSARAFSIAAKLLVYGADKEFLSSNLFRNNSLEAMKFVGMLLGRIQTTGNVMRLRHAQSELAAAGIDETQVELILMLLTSVHHRGVYALFKIHDTDDAPYMKCSLRAANDDLDVARLAEQFWGGWHKASSWARFAFFDTKEHSIEKATTALNQKLTDYLQQHALNI